ncbi:hypothetical protein Y1Q_0008219 [Alligator mississippiensis]|uniref:Uncharacterized protein n=1 Tax=Alligator mississippiensis TaxID=8496 RepID=A0A151N1E5_ALLMI|nr:hypothetical protein Y1Q_0008219 [Alligator mississippiensis]
MWSVRTHGIGTRRHRAGPGVLGFGTVLGLEDLEFQAQLLALENEWVETLWEKTVVLGQAVQAMDNDCLVLDTVLALVRFVLGCEPPLKHQEVCLVQRGIKLNCVMCALALRLQGNLPLLANGHGFCILICDALSKTACLDYMCTAGNMDKNTLVSASAATEKVTGAMYMQKCGEWE